MVLLQQFSLLSCCFCLSLPSMISLFQCKQCHNNGYRCIQIITTPVNINSINTRWHKSTQHKNELTTAFDKSSAQHTQYLQFVYANISFLLSSFKTRFKELDALKEVHQHEYQIICWSDSNWNSIYATRKCILSTNLLNSTATQLVWSELRHITQKVLKLPHIILWIVFCWSIYLVGHKESYRTFWNDLQ